MRTRKTATLEITSGCLLICDPSYIFEPVESAPYVKLPRGSVYFDDFGGDGNFKVHSDGVTIVVDTAPGLFRAKSRSDFSQLKGKVPVDSGMMAFLDGSDIAQSSAQSASLLFVTEVPNGTYRVWEEEKDSSWAFRNRILCFGPEVTLLINGPDANELSVIEKEVAQVLRLKGSEKRERLHVVQETLTELHLSGMKDRRLRMLADAVKLTLPRRSKKKGPF